MGAIASAERVPPRAAFGHRDFRLFQVSRFLGMVALQAQSVAVGWQVYNATERALDLGLVGLAQFLPALLLALVAGQVADRTDRRRVIAVSQSALALCAVGLFVFGARIESLGTAPLYAVLTLTGVARVFAGPAGQALMPQLVPKRHFENAVAWSSSIWQAAIVAGPAIGGLLCDLGGPGSAYLVCASLWGIAAAFALRIGPHAEATTLDAGGRPAVPDRSLRGVLAGVRYVWNRKVVLGAISLDLFAVLLGGAVALLPIYARDILRVGPGGLGVLRSAPAIGAGAMAVLLAHLPPLRRSGVVLFVSVALFGAMTVVFGLSRSFPLSLAALFLVGAADMVSVVVRHTLVQMATPPELRGRVSAVNLVFIGASNELGEFESGITAAWFGTEPAVVLGGIGTLLVVAAWSVLFPDLRRVDRLQDALAERAPGT